MSGVLSTIPTIETSDGLISYVVLACLNGDATIKVFDLIVATPIATVAVPKANTDAIAYARSVSDVMQSVTSSLSSSKNREVQNRRSTSSASRSSYFSDFSSSASSSPASVTLVKGKLESSLPPVYVRLPTTAFTGNALKPPAFVDAVQSGNRVRSYWEDIMSKLLRLRPKTIKLTTAYDSGSMRNQHVLDINGTKAGVAWSYRQIGEHISREVAAACTDSRLIPVKHTVSFVESSGDNSVEVVLPGSTAAYMVKDQLQQTIARKLLAEYVASKSAAGAPNRVGGGKKKRGAVARK
jgi:hypothetical protein